MSNEGSSSNGIVHELLNNDNYVKWSCLVKTYLISQDLWGVVVPGNYLLPLPQQNYVANNNNQVQNVPRESAPKVSEEPHDVDQTPKGSDEPGEKHDHDEAKHDHRDKSQKISEASGNKHQSSQAYTPSQVMDNSWGKRNATALHTIQISCGSEALSVILSTDTASYAWSILEAKFKPQFLKDLTDQPNHITDKISEDCEALHKALIRGDWPSAEAFLNEGRVSVTAIINRFQETPLHVAACYGHTHIVEELLKLIPSNQDLERRQISGYTALSLAAMTGIVPMARCLVSRNKNLARILSLSNELPVQLALSVGQIDMARYLYPLAYLEDLTNYNYLHGVTLLCQFILSKNFDIALDLIKRCPKLIISKSTVASPCPIILAMCKFAFPSGTPLSFWQRWIYDWIYVPPISIDWSSTLLSDESGEPDSSSSSSGSDSQINIGGEWDKDRTYERSLLHRIGSYLSELLGTKKMYELKLVHIQSQEFLHCTLEYLRRQMNRRRVWVTEIAQQAMIKAVEEGNVEFIITLSKAIPEMIRCADHRLRTVFSYAVECRQAEIFSLVHGFPIIKEEIAALVDDSGNTVLHVAGKLAPSSHLSQISGAALQMQRELQWFKEVESIMQNKLVVKEYFKNGKNMTPREYFTENHKQLAIDGEKWMKETATNCTFVSALIVTIMFAAAFIVPGGTEGEKSTLKVISHQKWFLLYIISDAISLFSSTTSVLMFLGILTSRYYEDAFLKSLPTKLIIGLSTLFFSIATMMIAFCSALYVMLQGQLSILIPVVLLASILVSLFVKLQFPLLVEIFASTYGQGIFTRKYNWLSE